MNNPRNQRNLAVFATLLLASPALLAQFRASIQGTVTDPSGAVISGATLTLTDLETSKALTATSNASGTYNFSALAPDRYKLSSTASGFTPQVIDDLQLIPEQANAVNVQMTVAGGPATSVTVSGSSVANLDTETASISGSVDSNQIQHLPSAGRDVFQLVQLAPGVFGDGSQGSGGGGNNLPGTQGPGSSGSGIFQTENGPQANANGGQYESNSIAIDGISTVSAVWGGTSVITPTEDSVGNVKVVANGYDAEEGRFSGAQVQITSKTGSNQYHGSLFFRVNRPGLNAYQRFNGPGTFNTGSASSRGLLRDTTRANQEGGSVGGPILHNKVFAFFAYETQRNNSSVTGTGWYETPAFEALAPSGSIAAKYLGFKGAAVAASSIVNETCTQAGFVENTNCITIPGQGLNLGSPLKQALGTQDFSWKSTTNPGIGGGLDPTTADVALYNTLNPTSTVASQYNGRLDSDVTKADHIAFAIYWVPLATTTYQGTVRSYNLYHHDQTNDAYSVIWNHVFSPSFLNEARANDAGWRWNEVLNNPQEPFGLPQSQVGDMANISGGSALAFFGAPGPSDYDQHTYTYKDVATKVLSNHTVKFGGEVTRLYYLNNPTGSARPSYTFYNIWDFLNDAPHTEQGSFNPATGTPITNRQDDREDLYGFFVQDDWKALPNLTLNAGLRYSYFGPLSSKEQNLNRVILGSGANAYTDLYIHHGGNLTNAQKGNFGPQFGFSYSPGMLHGKGVVRGGFGLNFNQTEIAISSNAGGNPPNVLAVNYTSGSPTAIDPRIVYAVAADSSSLFGYPANPNAVGGFNAQNLPTAGGAFISAFQSTQPTIYTEHFSLDTQFDLGHQLVGTAGYQGSLGRHLIVQSFSYVDAFANGQAQNPLVQNVDYYGNTGNSSNNSLLLGLKHQMSHDIMFDAEFAYAKTMDTGSGPYFENPYPYEPGLAYGRSDFNYGKAFKLYGLWQPVFFHNNSLLSKVADGFSFSGIYNIHTGFPYTPTYNVPGGNLYYAASGYNSLRPAALLPGSKHDTSNSAFEAGKPNTNFPLNQSLASNATSSPYFLNPVAPTAGANGFASGLPSMPGIGRNSLNGPGYQDVDGTVTKSFGLPNARVIGESAKFEIRVDAFNLFNETNVDSSKIVTNYLQQNFGQSTGGLAGRIVNIQARFSF